MKEFEHDTKPLLFHDMLKDSVTKKLMIDDYKKLWDKAMTIIKGQIVKKR